MIKYFFLLSVIFLCMCGCGPSQDDIEKQQRIDDSIMEIERVSIIEKANQIFEQANTTDSIIETDTITK